MKFKILIIIHLLLFLSNNSFAKVENSIVLKIENEIITTFEIKNKILSSLVLANQEVNQSNINKLKKQAVDYLIQQKLKKIELEKYNFKRDQVQLDNYLNNISSNNIDNLKKKFINNNVDFDLFVDDLDIDLKWQKYIYQVYSKKIEIDKQNINKELENLLKNKSNVEQYRISEIEISLDNNVSDKEKIADIENQIKEFGFEITALKFSISSSSSNKGDLGWMNAKSLNNKIYKIIKNMKEGEVTKPLISTNSALFLKLNKKRISKVQNLNVNELRANLINQKKNELFNLYSKSLLSKLKNTSLIQYN